MYTRTLVLSSAWATVGPPSIASPARTSTSSTRSHLVGLHVPSVGKSVTSNDLDISPCANCNSLSTGTKSMFSVAAKPPADLSWPVRIRTVTGPPTLPSRLTVTLAIPFASRPEKSRLANWITSAVGKSWWARRKPPAGSSVVLKARTTNSPSTFQKSPTSRCDIGWGGFSLALDGFAISWSGSQPLQRFPTSLTTSAACLPNRALQELANLVLLGNKVVRQVQIS
mmetsp:Transcript_23311/g.70024  ORF Transcript_23311/g.70024 Transcript_23311/m.70024 type:complete len:226 (+) Transcript_23311:1383-2060(+)